MNLSRQTSALALALILLSVALVAASCDSEGASGDTARVFIGDGTDSGTSEYSGTGSTVKEILEDALGSNGLVINASGTVRSLGGVENSGSYYWMIFQWRPPTGWVSTYANSTGDAYLDDGTSYYVFYSEKLSDGPPAVYSTPSFEPTATAYFFIKFVEDSNANSYVTSVLTEEERMNGFWISGTGSDVAAAFSDACASLRALGNSGFELVMNDDRTHELYGWLGSFMGLEDESLPDGLWNNWSQFSWSDETGSWTYNQWCLGYYDPGVTPYFSLVRQITADDNATAGVGVTPSDIPSEVIRGSCTVTFVDGDGQVMKTQTVSYFGSATAPSDPTKSPSNGVTYEFTGWDRDFDQVTSNITVTAQFTASSTPSVPEDPDDTDDPETPGDTVPVTGVTISSGSLQLTIGGTHRLTAAVSPTNATDRTVTWSSSDTSVATVDASGNVTAVSAGTAVITVTTTDGGHAAQCTVTVLSEDAVTSISLEFDAFVMSVGSERTLGVSVGPAGAADRSVTWSSSDPSVATVDDDGNVTAVGAGTAVITVTSNSSGISASCAVTVIGTGSGSVSVTVTDDGGGSSTATVNVGQGTDVTEVVVNTSQGSVSLSGDAVSSIADPDGNITVTVSEFDESGLWDDQLAVIGSLSSSVTIYEYLINGGEVTALGGTATVSMPYVLAPGEDPDAVRVYCLYTDGSLETFDCEYSDGYVTFRTTHFSLYFATSEDVTGATGGGDADDDGGSDTMLYVGIAVAIIVIAVAAVAVIRGRH